MSQISNNVVDITVARNTKDDVDKAIQIEKIKRVAFIFAVILTVGFAGYLNNTDKKRPLLNAQIPSTAHLDNGDVEVTIEQQQSGHYLFIGEINRKKVKILVDTGATYVAVPPGIARYLGMPFEEIYYSNTANGKSMSYKSTANQIKVGGIEMFDVQASVATGLEGDVILLGMSFFKNLSLVQENETLKIISRNKQLNVSEFFKTYR